MLPQLCSAEICALYCNTGAAASVRAYAVGVLSLRQSGTLFLSIVTFALVERKSDNRIDQKYHAAAGKYAASWRTITQLRHSISVLVSKKLRSNVRSFLL